MYHWIAQCEQQNVPITWDLIKRVATDLAPKFGVDENDLSFSHGWQQRFAKRFELSMNRIHGESGSADINAVHDNLPHTHEKICQYAPRDIYNVDETMLFYASAPLTTISRDSIQGVKQDKSRLTIALTVNADASDFREPLFIGNSANPACFKKKVRYDIDRALL